MAKFSVVIPTLWKSDRIHKLLDDLIKCDNIDEIILIDNSNQYYDFYDNVLGKINLIQPGENIYVNPAWNLGVKMSKSYYIALLNDDISFNVEIFEFLKVHTMDRFGIIGMDKTNYDTVDFKPKLNKETDRRTQRFGWGCFILFDRRYWIDIPDNLKIWYGDDYIRIFNKAPVSYLTGFPIETEMSTTSGETTWNERKQLDYINIMKYINSR